MPVPRRRSESVTGVKTYVGKYLSRVPMQSEALARVARSLDALPSGRWLLAVSGGRDSMVLLDAMATHRGGEIAGVASFDHGTGAAATRAVALVERLALSLQLPVVTGALPAGAATDEASWRAARWRFLRGWAEEMQASVVTAHTRDDQVETVVLRILRDAGARGLAGMLGTAGRPFLTLGRSDIAAYADARGLEFIEDPSNRSMAFARNRVRHEILPALERAQPGFSDWCWQLAARAAALRAEVADWVDATLEPVHPAPSAVAVRAESLSALDVGAAATIWPEVAARVGVTMDRRGIARVVAWAPTAKPKGRIQLSGGAEVLRTASTFVIRLLY